MEFQELEVGNVLASDSVYKTNLRLLPSKSTTVHKNRTTSEVQLLCLLFLRHS